MKSCFPCFNYRTCIYHHLALPHPDRRQVFCISPPVSLLASMDGCESPGRSPGRARAAAAAGLLGPAPLSFPPAHPPCPALALSVPSSRQVISPNSAYLSFPGNIISSGAAILPAQPRPQEPAGRGRLKAARGGAQASVPRSLSPGRGACLAHGGPTTEDGRLL